jgi:hypothetical protein
MASRTGWKSRVLIGTVAAVMLIALAAVPSFGASKKYTLDVTPSQAFAGVSADFTFTITNTTPGNSTINSILIGTPTSSASPPLPSFTATALTASILSKADGSSNLNLAGTVTPVGTTQLKVQNIDSLKTNQVIKIKVTATFADPSPGTCTTATEQWNVTSYAGNSLSGDTFANQGTDAQRSLTLNSASCIHLEFVDGRAPADAIQGEPITNTNRNTPAGQPVQVALMAGTTPVDVTTSGDAVSLSISEFEGSAVPPGTAPGVLANFTSDFSHGVATFDDGLKISNALNTPPTAGGDYRLKASYLSYPSVPSDPFRIFDAEICGAGSPEGAESYQEDSQTTLDGQVTINTTNDECFGIIVDNTPGATGSGNIEDWSVTKSSVGLHMQGTLDFVWDLPGTTPVKWTQVTWGVPGQPGFVDYHDVRLCNPGVAVDDYDNLFPTIPGSTYGAEQMCLFSSELVNTVSGWTQLETVAYNTDYGGRK